MKKQVQLLNGKLAKSIVLPFCLLFLFCFFFQVGQAQTTKVEGFSGSTTFTVPSGITEIIVEVWGAGGAGGRNTDSKATGGGGGGAYTISTLAVTPGDEFNITIGAAGVSSGTRDGGASSIAKSTDSDIPLVLAAGGKGVNVDHRSGAAGGAAGDCIPPTTAKSGGNGGNGYYGFILFVPSRNGGGGGGAAGPSGNGGTGGEATYSNRGSRGQGNSGIAGNPGTGGLGDDGIGGSPSNGSNYGGGGSGSAGTSNENGGNGAGGYVRITMINGYFITSTSSNSPICPDETTAEIKLTSVISSVPVGSYTIEYTIDGVKQTATTSATNSVENVIEMTFTTATFSVNAIHNIEITSIQGSMDVSPSLITENNTTTITRISELTVTADDIEGPREVCISTKNIDYEVNTIPGVTDYAWSVAGAGWSITSSANTEAITVDAGTADGTFTLTLTDDCGRTHILNFPVTINALPVLDLQDQYIGCVDGEITLSVTEQLTFDTYAWATTAVAATTFATIDNDSLKLTALTEDYEGKYYVTVTDINGCVNMDSTVLRVNELPIVTLTAGSYTLTGASLTPYDLTSYLTVTNADTNINLVFNVNTLLYGDDHDTVLLEKTALFAWNFDNYKTMRENHISLVKVVDEAGCVGSVNGGIFIIDVKVCNGSETIIITCPDNILDELAYNECEMTVSSLGTYNLIPASYVLPIHPGSFYVVTNDSATVFPVGQGAHKVTWIAEDTICNVSDFCEQMIYINFPTCGTNDIYYIDNTGATDSRTHTVLYYGIDYPTTRIDCHCWLARNLENELYADGATIPFAKGYVADRYPDVDANIATYGRLYDWNSATRNATVVPDGYIQGACPDGWAIPTGTMVETLVKYGSDALKSNAGWLLDKGGSNSTGFSLLPAGHYDPSADAFQLLLGDAYFWSTEDNTTTAKLCHCLFSCPELTIRFENKNFGYSVRCVQMK